MDFTDFDEPSVITPIGVSSGAQASLDKFKTAGPLEALDRNTFQVNVAKYPSDIENLAHAMIININVQEKSKDADGAEGRSRAQELRAGTTLGDAELNILDTKITFNRKTKRIKDKIALYMPEGLTFQEHESYEEPNLLNTLGPGVSVLAEGMSGDKGWESFIGGALIATSMINKKAGPIFRRLTDAGGIVQTAVKAGFGYAINPIVDVLYSHPNLRTFNFDFNFAPRSADEANQVLAIIQTLRRHKAPEFVDGDIFNGAFFLPPSEFDITFVRNFGNGYAINGSLPTISTCVLKDIVVNYTPEGQFVTFSDGTPVHIQMSLQFTEVNIITRKDIDGGF